ncbi:MAG: hypothetical protein ABH803_00145 [Candidatus Micrarchaeota archaeon]
MRRSQISVELMSIVALLLLMLVVFTFVFFSQRSEVFRDRVALDGASVCRIIEIEADAAFSIGEGYSASFVLPAGLLTEPYAVSLIPLEHRIRVEWEKGFCEAVLRSNSFGGSLFPGENILRNNDGFVEFN